MAGLLSGERVNGDLNNFNRDGISYLHHDIDHNKSARDMPFSFCDILYAQYTYFNGTKYRIAIAISHTHEIKIGHSWGQEFQWRVI